MRWIPVVVVACVLACRGGSDPSATGADTGSGSETTSHPPTSTEDSSSTTANVDSTTDDGSTTAPGTTSSAPVCGDGLVEEGEACEGEVGTCDGAGLPGPGTGPCVDCQLGDPSTCCADPTWQIELVDARGDVGAYS